MMNISSTPMPSIKIGNASEASFYEMPAKIPHPYPAETESKMQMTPTIAMLNLQCVGPHEPKKMHR